MHTFLTEKAFLPSLVHNDVFAYNGLERLSQTIGIAEKVLSRKCLGIICKNTGTCRLHA